MWLKGQSTHAHGLGSPQYLEFHTLAELEVLKDEFDSDGLRQPVFEIIDKLPPDVRESKIKAATQSVEYQLELIARLINERPVEPAPSPTPASADGDTTVAPVVPPTLV